MTLQHLHHNTGHLMQSLFHPAGGSRVSSCSAPSAHISTLGSQQVTRPEVCQPAVTPKRRLLVCVATTGRKSHLRLVVDDSEAVCRHPQHGAHGLLTGLETRQGTTGARKQSVGRERKTTFPSLTSVLLPRRENVSGRHTQTHKHTCERRERWGGV